MGEKGDRGIPGPLGKPGEPVSQTSISIQIPTFFLITIIFTNRVLKEPKVAKDLEEKLDHLDLLEKKEKLVLQVLLVIQEDQEIRETRDNKVVTVFQELKVNEVGMVQ